MDLTGTSRPPRCKHHRTALAGWSCDRCEATLCPECVEARRKQTVDVLCCRTCGGAARTLFVHRSWLTPFAARLRRAWRYPFTSASLALALTLGALLAVFDFFSDGALTLFRWIPSLLGAGLFWGSFFAIVRASARGESETPAPDYSDLFSDWIAPALRGLVATSVVWGPTLLYLLLLGGWDLVGQLDKLMGDPMFHMRGELTGLPREALLRNPAAWLLALAGVLYFPMALMLAGIGAETAALLSPLKALRAILRLRGDYARVVGVLLHALVLVLLIRAVVARVGVYDLFTVSRWLGQVAECLVLFGLAHALGLLLHVRGDVLGYGHESDYIIPMLPDAVPSTTLRTRELDLLTQPGPAEEPAPESPAPESPDSPAAQLQALASAVDARDVARALLLYPTLLHSSRSAIAPATHLFVGQAAATHGDYPLAVRALETAADSAPEDPLAPRALVLLARVLGERMQDTARSQDVYRYIIERYPETDASRFARERLPPTT